jgi:tryptophan-rich sensory protein
MEMKLRDYLGLAAFVLGVVGMGSALGVMNVPDGWYAGLVKPSFNPPNWVFAPVWTALYVMIAVAGWRVWRREGWGQGMALWSVQMGLNFAWSPVFFGLHLPGVALAVLLAMLAAIAGFIFYAARVDRGAALLFAPYAAWVGFAAVLNMAIVGLN